MNDWKKYKRLSIQLLFLVLSNGYITGFQHEKIWKEKSKQFCLPAVLTNFIGQGTPWFCKWICPSGTLFGGIPLLAVNVELRESIGLLFGGKIGMLPTFLFLSIITLRPFCKYLCPLGIIYGMCSHASNYHYEVEKDKYCRHRFRRCADRSKENQIMVESVTCESISVRDEFIKKANAIRKDNGTMFKAETAKTIADVFRGRYDDLPVLLPQKIRSKYNLFWDGWLFRGIIVD